MKKLLLLVGLMCGLAFYAITENGLWRPDFQKELEGAALIIKNGESKEITVAGAEKLCFQPPFATREGFEKFVGRRVDGYKVIESDVEFSIYAFHADGSHQRALMKGPIIRLDREVVNETCRKSKTIELRRVGEFVLIKFS
jgi:hypothetical protein